MKRAKFKHIQEYLQPATNLHRDDLLYRAAVCVCLLWALPSDSPPRHFSACWTENGESGGPSTASHTVEIQYGHVYGAVQHSRLRRQVRTLAQKIRLLLGVIVWWRIACNKSIDWFIFLLLSALCGPLTKQVKLPEVTVEAKRLSWLVKHLPNIFSKLTSNKGTFRKVPERRIVNDL